MVTIGLEQTVEILVVDKSPNKTTAYNLILKIIIS